MLRTKQREEAELTPYPYKLIDETCDILKNEECQMSYSDVEVRITVRVNGERVGRRKIKRSHVLSLDDGRELLDDTYSAVDSLANELRIKAGV